LATRPLHDALSAWSATLSPSERRDVEAVVTSLARASGEASLLGRSGNKARIGSLLAQLAVAVRPGKLVVSPGSLADLAKVVGRAAAPRRCARAVARAVASILALVTKPRGRAARAALIDRIDIDVWKELT
jgi:hypothetical protein